MGRFDQISPIYLSFSLLLSHFWTSSSIYVGCAASPKAQATPKTQAKLSAEEASRKRSRLGDPALTSTGPGSVLPEAKRRALAKPSPVKPASAPAKPGRKPKGEESRLGVKRQKKEGDLKFEECCQAVMGARVGVWWEDDHCYYKVSTAKLSPLQVPVSRRRPSLAL